MSSLGYEDARSWAAYWAQRWFLDPEGQDRLAIADGVQAGWATHIEAYLVLQAFASEHLGLLREKPSLLSRVKSLGWDRFLRMLGLRALGGGRPSETIQHPVAFIVEIPTPPMIEPTRLVATALPSSQRLVACADPRALWALRRAHVSAQGLLLPIGEQRECLRTAGSDYLAALRRVNDRPPQMLLRDSDVARPAMEAIMRGLSHSLPWIAVEHRALLRLTELARPRSLAIASDQHRVGRLATEVGRSIGVPVTVLQHGMPQAEIGYLPVVADRVAAWSPASADWFVARGTERDRLEVLGNPRLDQLVTMPRIEKTSNSGQINLLLALSPTAVPTNERVLSSALDALVALPGAELTIKLHPGHREWDWVGHAVARAGIRDRVTISRRRDIAGLLRWAHITLVHRSSVALESLAAGVPVVAILSDLPSAADAELRALDLPRAADGAELVGVLGPLREPAGRAEWLSDREERIASHAGPLDGRSAARIATALMADMPRG